MTTGWKLGRGAPPTVAYGSIFHITWSLDKAAGRRAVESNIVLREQGWTAWNEAIPITPTGLTGAEVAVLAHPRCGKAASSIGLSFAHPPAARSHPHPHPHPHPQLG
jgi:hypothetical protein